jgi:hypothetical protein
MIKRIAGGMIMTVVLLYGCQPSTPKQAEGGGVTAALQAPYAQIFYDSLTVALQSYYELTDALVKADSTRADLFAITLKQHMDSLPVHQTGADSSRIAEINDAVGSISAELAGLVGEKDLESKRTAFHMVSDMLFDLVKTTGLKGKTIYRQYCPMAFNDQGAYWLSDKEEILNPYFGNKMLHCGDVTDTLSYR